MGKISKVPINNKLYEDDDFLKDCPGYEFRPTILPSVPRIIAIGDIHGDLELAINSFKLAGLIDDDHNWIANPPTTIVVQVGDQIDSCRPIANIYDCHNKKYHNDNPEDMKVIEFFNKIHQRASIFGGAVYSLLGNHEIMNVQGKFDYVSYSNFHDFYHETHSNKYIGKSGRKDAFTFGGPIANMLACTRQTVLIIGSIMFIHAGILPIVAKRLDYLNINTNTKLQYLNSIVRKWLLKKLSDSDNTYITALISNLKISPFWTRIFGSIPNNISMNEKQCSDYVKRTLEVFKLGNLVVGHTPQLFTNMDGINGTCYEKSNNKLYRVDGGFSKAFDIFGKNDRVQVLEILNDNEFRIITEKINKKSRKSLY